MPEPQKTKSEKKPQARGFNPHAMAQAQALNQQPDSIPAMMKPGEYVLPPDTVAAMGGPQALDATVAQTHTPANAGAIVPRGFGPKHFFANGGLVEDEEQKPKPISPANIYPQGSPSAGANVYGGAIDAAKSAVSAATNPQGGQPLATGAAQVFGQREELQQQGRERWDASVAARQPTPTQPAQPVGLPAAAAAPTPRAQFVADQNQKLDAANTQLAERTAQLNERYKPAPNSPTNTFPANRLPVENGQPQQAPTAPAVTSGFASAQDGMTNDFGRQPSSPTPMAAAAPSTAPKTPASDPQSRINEQIANAQRQRAEGIAAVQRGQAYDSITQQQRQQAYDTWQSTRQPGILPQPRSDMRQQEAEKSYSELLAGRSTSVPQQTSQPVGTAAAAPERTLEQLGKQLGGLDRQHAQNVQLQSAARTPEQARAEVQQTEGLAQLRGLPGVYQHGRGQYSDNAQGMGFAPGFTGQPSARNMQAAGNLSAQQQAQSAARVAAAQQEPVARGFPGFAAPEISHSGNDWSTRNELRSLRMAAERAMENAPRKRFAAQHPAVQAYQAALQADMAARTGGQAALQAKTNDTNAGLVREQMQQQGATQRDMARNAIDQQRVGLDGQRLGMEAQQQQEQSQVRGFEIRGAQRREGILQQFDAAKTDQERAQLQQRYPDVFGKSDKENLSNSFMKVKVPIMDERGNVVGDQEELIDLRTLRQGGANGQGAQSGIPKVGDTRDGYRYKGGNPNDKASWQKL